MDLYKLFMALGVAAGALAWWWQQRRQPPVNYLPMMCAVVVPGQVFGSLFASIEHPGFTLMDVLAGRYGANILGGVIGGVIVTWILLNIRSFRERFGTPLQVLDQAALFVPLSMAIGRVGCFASGDGCYGQPTFLPWGVAFPHGSVPTNVPVHPTMLYDAILLFIFFLSINYFYRGRFHALTPRIPLASFLIFYGCERFLSEFLRLNPKYAGLSQAQWLSITLVIIGISILLHRRRRLLLVVAL